MIRMGEGLDRPGTSVGGMGWWRHDGGEDLGAGVVGVDEGAAQEPFGFQSAHEGFGPGARIGISSRGHALLQVGRLEPPPEGPAAILVCGAQVRDWIAFKPRFCMRRRTRAGAQERPSS